VDLRIKDRKLNLPQENGSYQQELVIQVIQNGRLSGDTRVSLSAYQAANCDKVGQTGGQLI